MPSLASSAPRVRFTGATSDPTDRKRTTSVIEIASLAALSLLGALALLPNMDEKIAALIADRHYPRAVQMLEERAQNGPLNDYEAFSLARLYRQMGMNAKAAPLLEQMLAASPGSVSVLRELAACYRESQRSADELRILLQLFQRAPDAATNDRLIALYRERGDAVSEAAQTAAAAKAGIAAPAKISLEAAPVSPAKTLTKPL